MKKKSSVKKALAMIAGGVILTGIGVLVIPPILKKTSSKVYKKSLENEEIDFDDMGPEIVPKEQNQEEET